MRRLLAAILLLCLVAADDKWKRYGTKDDQFTVMFPGPPATESKSTPLGTTLNILSAKTAAGLFLAVVYGDSGLQGMTTEADKEKFLDGAPQSIKGEVLKQSKVFLGSHPGREFLIKTPEGVYSRSRNFIVNARSYELIMMAKQEELVLSADAEKFLTSFSIPEAMAFPPDASTGRLARIVGLVLGAVVVVLVGYRLARRGKRL